MVRELVVHPLIRRMIDRATSCSVETFPAALRDFIPKWGNEIGSQTQVYYLSLRLLIETRYLFKFTSKQAIQFHPFTTAQDVCSYLPWRYQSFSPLHSLPASDCRNPPRQHHLRAFHSFFFPVTPAPSNSSRALTRFSSWLRSSL